MFPDVAPNAKELRARAINLAGAGNDHPGETWLVTLSVGGSRGVKPWSTGILDAGAVLPEHDRRLVLVTIEENRSIWRTSAQRTVIDRFLGEFYVRPSVVAKGKPKPKR